MRGTKRFLAALILGIYIVTTLSTSIVFAHEEVSLPIAQEEVENSIEVIGEKQDIIEVDETQELDPSMYIDAEFNDDIPITEDDGVSSDETQSIVEESDEDVPVEETPELIVDETEVVEDDSSKVELDEQGETEVEENTTESEAEKEPIKEETTENVDEEIDEEVELEGLFNCNGNHYETKAPNVKYYNKATKGKTKKGTIASKGTVVKVVDSKYVGVWPFGEKYFKLDTGYWVLSDNIKSHDCTGGNRTTTYKRSQRSGDNKNHNLVKSVSAQKCTKCKCVMKKATSDTSKEKHSGWYSTGYCGVCGYKFKISEKNMTKANYMVKGDLYLKTEPYDAASNKGNKLSNVLNVKLKLKVHLNSVLNVEINFKVVRL